MNIEILSKTLPHNKHQLKRYLNFIEHCSNDVTSTYKEAHHILPKAQDMFPEYKSFSKHPWNRILLTPKQHSVAHIMLAKVYATKSSIYSASMMVNIHKQCKNSSLSIERNKLTSIRMKHNNPAKNITEEWKSNISKSMKGITKTEQAKANMKIAQNKPDQKLILSKKMKSFLSNGDNYTQRISQMDKNCRSKEALSKKSITMSKLKWFNDGVKNFRILPENNNNYFLGKLPDVKVTCPHCGKEGGKSGMTRHHFSKCKSFK